MIQLYSVMQSQCDKDKAAWLETAGIGRVGEVKRLLIVSSTVVAAVGYHDVVPFGRST